MNICILGAGAWGTAMALHLDRCGHAVTLVPRRIEQALAIASSRVNEDYLPGYPLPHTIQIGHELSPVLMEAEVVFLACPSKALRQLCLRLVDHLDAAWQLKLFVTMCKGLELETFKAPTETVSEVFPDIACAAFSGPTFAGEVAAGKPTAITFAVSADFEEAARYQEAFSSASLRVYLSRDVKGTELGGTLKNIYAIGAGLCDGLQLGDNAKAALLTRSLNEMVLLGQHLGGQQATFYGLSGFGDLVATCSGVWSRNRCFGERVGRGEAPATVIESQKTVVEGYRATKCLKALCEQKQIDAPILSQIYAILYEDKEPLAALQSLMSRELKHE
ncbi:NAD(P)H-dependent glycerol-3-phosphate dehydrogenase [Coraliomargarita parva]|uniref:NAD(P)H-dependent glycerol-3-phosphate dehydrogenase n=1 Tax=Coraliomargarita parva TaxID=3014050 RepID=UPI0022B3505D|nr:NAD(P)H-dependent glycerol-3-phosphate dehydrogenase [Coraliomargarita parva]